MQYQAEDEIKARMKRVGLTARDLANLLQEPPGTVSNRLNGYIPFLFNQRRTIQERLRVLEERKQLIENGEG